VAFVTILMASFRQNTRRSAELASTVMNIPCSASLTVKHQTIATCREQGRDPFDDLTDAINARFHGRKAPSLLHGM